MDDRTVQLVLQYDGADFSGWQRQPARRTVQGDLEAALARLCAAPVTALGSGRTDAGVNARGQAVGVRVPPRWSAGTLRRALNGVLPRDMWVAAAHEMRPEFHARYSAVARHYRYHVGLDEGAASPFRRRWEHRAKGEVAIDRLAGTAAMLPGEHVFRGFAVQGTAPADDDHRCRVLYARWVAHPGGVVFEIGANRFLHHMVRFLVGTQLDVATGRRDPAEFAALLAAPDNRAVSPPAPPHALFLERVDYPAELYLSVTP